MHLIADFLIRSIIRTRLFNDYLGSLTNTPVVQQFPLLFSDYNGTGSHYPPETNKTPPQNCLQRGSFMSLNSRKALFQVVSGIEKVHRNSIKITVDLWRRRWDSNPRILADQTISSSGCWDFTPPAFSGFP